MWGFQKSGIRYFGDWLEQLLGYTRGSLLMEITIWSLGCRAQGSGWMGGLIRSPECSVLLKQTIAQKHLPGEKLSIPIWVLLDKGTLSGPTRINADYKDNPTTTADFIGAVCG